MPSIEDLEGRIVLSTVSDGGTATLTIALANNETLGVQSEGSTYDFTLSGGSYTFTNSGVSNSGNFSGFGTSTLVLESAGISHYSTINITDANVSVGATGTKVDLLDSGSNTYSTNINITVDKNPEPADVQIQTSKFNGSAGLNVSTTGGIQVLSGSNGITTASGPITLDAGTSDTLTSGIGVDVQAPITSTSGQINLIGTGGVSTGSGDTGVRLVNGGLVTSGSGPVTINGSSGGDTQGGQAGVQIYSSTSSLSGVTSATGNVEIVGTANTSGPGVSFSSGTIISSTGTGTGAATITIDSSAVSSDGFIDSGPNSTITSVDGAIAISGTAGPSSSSGNAGVQMYGQAAVTSTGTDAHAAPISLTGTNNGPAVGLSIYNSNGGVTISSVGVGSDSGAITIEGTSTKSTGVQITGTGTALTTVDGDIGITGNAEVGSSGEGVNIFSGVFVTTSGTNANAGSIAIDGTASGSGAGLEMYTDSSSNGASISTNGTGADAGAITLTGSSVDSDGVYLQGGSVLVYSNDGDIAVNGSTSSGNGANSGVDVLGGSVVRAFGKDSTGGTIAVNGTDTGAGPGTQIDQGSELRTEDGSLNVTGNSSVGDAVDLSGSVQILGDDGGDITINGTDTGPSGPSYSDGVNINQSANIVTVLGTLQITGSSSSNNGVDITSNSTILASSSDNLTIKGTSTAGGTGGEGVNIDQSLVEDLEGNLSITGSSTSDDGVAITGTSSAQSTIECQENGNITINGTSTAGTSAATGDGVKLIQSQVETDAGGITMTGKSAVGDGTYLSSSEVSGGGGDMLIKGTTSSTNAAIDGIDDESSPVIATTSSTSGSLQIFGLNNGSGAGTVLNGPGTAKILASTAHNELIVDGTGGGVGLEIENGAGLATTGTQQVFLGGDSNTTTPSLDGVDILGTATKVTAEAGGVEIIGDTNTATGIEISGATVSTTNGGAIDINPEDGPIRVETGATVSAAGPLTLETTSAPTSPSGSDLGNVDVLTGATLKSTGGVVTIQAGNNVDVDATSTLSAEGLLTIQAGVMDAGLTNVSITLQGTFQSGSPIAIEGGPYNDSISFTPASSVGASLTGGGGDDSFYVDPANATGTVNVTGVPSGIDSLFIQGTAGNDTITANGTETTVGSGTVTYTDFPTVNVNGEGGTNSFIVTPSTTVSFNISGDNVNPLVDTLTVLTPPGQTSSTTILAPGFGHVTTTGGYQTIYFANIASLPQPTNVSDSGTSTLTITLGGNVTFATQATGNAYVFTSVGGPFNDAGVANAALFQGFGTNTLTLQASSVPSTYQTIDIIDSAAGDQVIFSNSGTNTYLASFHVTLSDSPKAEAVQINQSNFANSAGLVVSTTTGIQVLGALTTAGGPITLDGNTGKNDSGALIAVDVQAPINTSTGPISIDGYSGTSSVPNTSIGVRLTGSGLITTASGGVTIVGTAEPGSVDAGVEILEAGLGNVGVSVGYGSVNVTGYGSSTASGVIVESGAIVRSTGYGSIVVAGNSPGDYGVLLTDPGTSVSTVTGSIEISGTGESNTFAATDLENGATVQSTGSGASAAQIRVLGENDGNGPGLVLQSTTGIGPTLSSVDGAITFTGIASPGDAIQIDLLALVEATGAGSIQFTTELGNINVNGGTVSTGTGFLNLKSAGNAQIINTASVTSNNNAVTIKAGDNVTIDASSVIYAEAPGSTYSISGGTANTGGVVTLLGYLFGATQGQVLGGNGADTITVAPVLGTGGFSISGGPGNDAITVDADGQISGSVNVNEAAGAGTDTLTIQGSNSGDLFNVGGLATIVDGHAITYTPYIPSIIVQGLAGGDTYLVSPSLTAAFTSKGNSPTSGNSLTVFAPQGQTSTLINSNPSTGSGAYQTTGGYGNVTFSGIQTLAPPNTATPSVSSVAFNYGNGQSFTVQNALPRDLPWQVKSITFTFNEAVNASLNSLTFAGTGAPTLLTLTGSGTNTLTWTFASPISAASVIATLSSSGVTAVSGGKALSGNTATSGANNFEIAMQVLYGDVDGDGTVTSRDAVLILSYISTQSSTIPPIFLDVNGDGVVNTSDYIAARGQLGHTI